MEVILANSADGAHPIIGEFLKGSTGLDAVIGIAYFGVVHVAAYVTYILLHSLQFFLVNIRFTFSVILSGVIPCRQR